MRSPVLAIRHYLPHHATPRPHHSPRPSPCRLASRYLARTPFPHARHPPSHALCICRARCAPPRVRRPIPSPGVVHSTCAPLPPVIRSRSAPEPGNLSMRRVRIISRALRLRPSTPRPSTLPLSLHLRCHSTSPPLTFLTSRPPNYFPTELRARPPCAQHTAFIRHIILVSSHPFDARSSHTLVPSPRISFKPVAPQLELLISRESIEIGSRSIPHTYRRCIELCGAS